MKTNDLRKLYLDFFKLRNHKVFSSDSLVPSNDPSLLFTGAGMNQFKAYFLGQKKDVTRATSCQKCLRTADLERVGKTAYHHTFFEMLGNFSFGDYFKVEAIAYGWEFVTKVLGLHPSHLWVSVYDGDDEAYEIWKNKIGIMESRIVRMGAIDNFWPSNAKVDGPNGPCGPCSEIYVGEHPGEGVEIWNLVFTQFDRQSDGSLLDLPQRNIDTGMGLERAAAVLQGVESNFDTDNFKVIRSELWGLLRKGGVSISDENAVMDHVRAAVFAIADGALPSNEGRGYVIRKLIRYGSDRLEKAGATQPGQFYKLVPAIIQVMKGAYPELAQRATNISAIIENEERSYLETLRMYLPMLRKELEKIRAGQKTEVELEALAFKFRDTYGVPYDNIVACIHAEHMSIDTNRFNEFMEEQRKRSRESTKIAGEIFAKDELLSQVVGFPETVFMGYDKTRTEAKLLAILKDKDSVQDLKAGDEGFLLFDCSVFYAESGGQVGDAGVIQGPGFEAEVIDAKASDKRTLHHVKIKQGTAQVGMTYTLAIDQTRRHDIMKNHTATHLLHSALRKTLGDHVKQSGSLVSRDYLRFDFTHFNALKTEELQAVEAMVNAEIQKNTPLQKESMAKDEAIRRGAAAFFGEKYGDTVRVVSIGDFSKELCGGTHLERTGEIELFKILSEGSIQAGVRRIEAVTGRAAKEMVTKNESELSAILREFLIDASANPIDAFAKKDETVKALRARMQSVIDAKLFRQAKDLLEKAPKASGTRVLYLELPGAGVELLKNIYEALKGLKESFVLLGSSPSDEKIAYVVGSSDDLVAKLFRSNDVIKSINDASGGSGGGRPNFAVGGTKDLDKTGAIKDVGLAAIRKLLGC